MKKLFVIALVLLFLFVICSCSTMDVSESAQLTSEPVEERKTVQIIDDVIFIDKGLDSEIQLIMDGGHLVIDINQLESLINDNTLEAALAKISVSKNGVDSHYWKKDENSKKYHIQWNLDIYTITYDDVGIIVSSEEAPTEDTVVEKNPSREESVVIVSDTRPTEYTSFDEVHINSLPFTLRYGYDFVGWKESESDSSDTTLEYVIRKGSNGNRSLVAVWTPKTISISYDLQDGIFEAEVPDNYIFGSDSFVIPEPVKDYYTFVGWLVNDSENVAVGPYHVDTHSDGNLMLKAVWAPVNYSIGYDISGLIISDADNNEIDTVELIPASEKQVNPDSYTVEDDFYLIGEEREGYEFMGWIENGDDIANYDSSYHIEYGTNGEKNFVAVWKALSFAISYDLNGGNLVEESPDSFTYGEEPFKVPEPTREHYIFGGWIVNEYDDPVKDYTVDTSSTHDLALKAYWIPVEYKISYDLDGGRFTDLGDNPVSYNADTDSFSLFAPEKDGFEFVGWNAEVTEGTYGPDYVLNLSNAGYNMILEVWADHATLVLPEFVDSDTISNLILEFGRKYKKVAGSFNVVITGNTVSFEYPEENGQYLTEYFSSNDNTMQSVVISKGSYGDRKYRAIWDVINYSISYDSDGIVDGQKEELKKSNPVSYTVLDEFTLINPEREGYTFKGWITEGEDSSLARNNETIITGTTGDKSYIPVWAENIYTINYNLNGGSLPEGCSNPYTYSVSSKSFFLKSPERKGYTFIGWKMAGTSDEPRTFYYISGSNRHEDLNLDAIWRANEYRISYNLNGGKLSEANPSSYTVDDKNFVLVNPEKTGYCFAGWKLKDSSDEPVVSYTVKTSEMTDIKLEAVWEPIEYTITYSDAGCYYKYDIVNPVSYTIESDDIVIATPHKDGYSFKGWVVSGDRTETLHESYVIRKGSFGDIKLYAEFSLQRYPVGSITEKQLDIAEFGKNGIPRPDWVISTPYSLDGMHIEKAYAKMGDFISSYDEAVRKARIQCAQNIGYQINIVDKNVNDVPYLSATIDANHNNLNTFVVEYWEDAVGGVWVLVATEQDV